MTTIATAFQSGLCPEPRDFFRHGNIPKKSEKEKAEAQCSDFFGLLLEYSLIGCVPALPVSASSSIVKYNILPINANAERKKWLPSADDRFKLITPNNELYAHNSQEANHE